MLPQAYTCHVLKTPSPALHATIAGDQETSDTKCFLAMVASDTIITQTLHFADLERLVTALCSLLLSYFAILVDTKSIRSVGLTSSSLTNTETAYRRQLFVHVCSTGCSATRS